MLHKINIEEILLHDSMPYYLRINEKREICIRVKKSAHAKLIIIGNSSYELTIIAEDDSSLLVNSINHNNSVDVKIQIYENSNVTYNHSVVSKIDSINNFELLHQSKNSQSTLNNSGVNLGNNTKLFFEINGVIPKKLININCNQNSRIINFDNGNSKVIPNLVIDSNDIIASHSAYIGKIDREEIFYLESRGLDKITIEKLIYKAIMCGKMDFQEEKEEFSKLINEWW